MTLPNFLVVGASKSGTTSLFDYLCQHPEVYGPPIKEPCYFSDGEPNFVYSDEEYEALFSGRTIEKAVGEASVSYLYDKEAPKRIHQLLGEAKIIIILRNPVTRAYSLWGQQFYKMGYEKLSFQEALRAESVRMASREFRENCPFYYGSFFYFDNGLYFEQVKRYYDTFGRTNVRVYIFEEFVRDILAICRDVFSFLGVNPDFQPVIHKRNVAPAVRSWLLNNFLLRPPGFLKRIYQVSPMPLKIIAYKVGRFFYWLNSKSEPRSPLDEGLRKELMVRYLPDIKKLEGLLGRDLSIWYSDDK